MYGVKSLLDVLNAEIRKYRLTRLGDVIARRRANVAQYRALLDRDRLVVPEERPDERIAYVMFLVQAEDRDALQAHLAEKGVQSLVYYGTPLHLHKAAERWGRYEHGDFPVAEAQ